MKTASVPVSDVASAVSLAVRAFSDRNALVISIARGVPTKSGQRRDLLRITDNSTGKSESYFLNASTDETTMPNGVVEQHFAVRRMRDAAPAAPAIKPVEMPHDEVTF